MRCPYCRIADSRVIDSRELTGLVRRRRLCPHCQQRFTTHERLAGSGLVVVKKDGRREPFDREKLLGGMRLACAKRPVPTGAIEAAGEAIEAGLFTLGEVEVPSERVGELALSELRKLDAVAYIRFASVYQRHADLESLQEAIERFGTSKKPAPGAPHLSVPRAS